MIRVLCVGKLKSDYLRDGIDDYARRMKRFARIECIEVRDGDVDSESQALLAKTTTARSILCDPRGEAWSSERLSEELGRFGSIDFLIGGPDGVNDTVRERVDASIAFGAITLPHELARLILYEQIYRGFCILNGHPYHR